MVTRRILLLLLALGAVARPAFAGRGPSSNPSIVDESTDQCLLILDQLAAWEQAKIRAGFVKVTLPPRIEPISVERADALRDFSTGLALFRSRWTEENVAFIRDILDRGARGKIKESQRAGINARLKEIRASLKTLRFLYIALSVTHKCPHNLDRLTTAVGKLRDAIQGKRSTMKDIRKVINRLALYLDPQPTAELELELRAFDPADRQSIDAWIRKTLRDSRTILEQKRGHPDQFHDVRKNFQAILAVYQVEFAYHPDREDWRTIATFLTQEAEDLGDANAVWERKDSRGKLDYEDDIVRYPKATRKKLVDFVDRVLGP